LKKPFPYANIAPNTIEDEILEKGARFLENLVQVLSNAESTQRLVNKLTETDAATGKIYLKIPVSNSCVVENALKLFSGLFGGLGNKLLTTKRSCLYSLTKTWVLFYDTSYITPIEHCTNEHGSKCLKINTYFFTIFQNFGISICSFCVALAPLQYSCVAFRSSAVLLLNLCFKPIACLKIKNVIFDFQARLKLKFRKIFR